MARRKTIPVICRNMVHLRECEIMVTPSNIRDDGSILIPRRQLARIRSLLCPEDEHCPCGIVCGLGMRLERKGTTEGMLYGVRF